MPSADPVAIVIPFDPLGDDHRREAFEYVLDFYGRNHPDCPVVVCGHGDGEWSKGAAIRNGVERPEVGDVFVLADADSFITDPAVLAEAIEDVRSGDLSWIVPHRSVNRLRKEETERIRPARLAPRISAVCRTPYRGTPGGGITVISREAFDEVGGIDDRFLGWGGEDVSFGYALETLVHKPHRMTGTLVHLWHPHPAPDLRGSLESEALVALYTEARGHPRRMRAVVDRVPWEPLPALEQAVRFRMRDARRSLRLFGSEILRFDSSGHYSTTDPDIADALRAHVAVNEVRQR